MDISAIEDWRLDPKIQSGVFLGFAHRRNIYGAQISVDKAIITAKHQIAYDVELFPFQQRDNSNDRMQFLQSLLKRKTAPISDSALDNDHLNSDATAPYPTGITIDDSSDDEQVTNLMQDVDNLSKVPPFNILDAETRRSDVSLHVPPKANPNVDEEFTALPSQRVYCDISNLFCDISNLFCDISNLFCDISCLFCDISCLFCDLSDVFCDISCLFCDISCLFCDISCLFCDISCLFCDISCLFCDISNLFCDISCLFCDISCLFCDLSDVFCDISNLFCDISNLFCDISCLFCDISCLFCDISNLFCDISCLFCDISNLFCDISCLFCDISNLFCDISTRCSRVVPK
jgi:hypothetical protein